MNTQAHGIMFHHLYGDDHIMSQGVLSAGNWEFDK